VYILSMPGAVSGSLVFRGDGDQFARNLKVYRGLSLGDKITEVAQYNANGLNDSTQVRVLNDSTAEVKATVPGTWLWKGYLGMYDHETGTYRVKTGPLLYQYTIKQHEPGAVYIYNIGPKWHEVKF
jgi:hypothetical protein